MENFAPMDAVKYRLEHAINHNNYAYYLALKWNYYREERDDITFEKLLHDIGRTKEYASDRKIALQCLTHMDIGEIPNKKHQRDFDRSFDDTRTLVEKVFSLNPARS